MKMEHYRALEGADPSSLLPPDMVEKSRAMMQLKGVFASQIPSRFGNVRTYISPVSCMDSALRADCKNTGCGVRAFVHIRRVNGEWTMVENGPQFDRTNRKCDECAQALD